MRTVVTIFKEELQNKKYVEGQVRSLCSEIKELENAVVFCPVPGKLVEFLSILKFHKISYGSHFDPNHQEEIVLKHR